MDNFKVIYKILKYLESAMDYPGMDMKPIRHEALGITKERWDALIKMLIDNGYVEGATIEEHIAYEYPVVELDSPRITLKGLEYLHENSTMQKVMKLAKGIKDIVPGM